MATCFASRLPKTTLYREFLTLDNPLRKEREWGDLEEV
jgi:hypothetical protein